MSFVVKSVYIILIINYFYKKILRFSTLQNYQLLVNMLFTNGYISVTNAKHTLPKLTSGAGFVS